VEEVEKRGMPTEIALLPMIESAFNPKAYSRSRAAGIWQFMPSTGRTFGLQQNWWVDDRRDIMAATDAALNYLQKLHEMFGDWDLALAAYNCGEGAVSRAIARNEAKGLPTDYLSLRLPNETRNYVPRLLAVKHMILHPQDFNASLGTLPNQPYFAQITTTQHIDVALAAKLGEISMDEFVSLNPHYNRPIISAKEPATILLPVDKADVFARNLEAYKKPLVSWQPYHGKRGERLDSIARRFKISTPRLKEANGIAAKSRRLAKNETLLVPGSASEATLDSTHFTNIKADSDVALAGGHYTVRHGDTLGSIARKHHVTIAQLKAWNGLKSQRIALNQKLAISLPTTHSAERATSHRLRVAKNESRKAAKPRRYTVRRGDTLYGIAQRFDVDLDDLRRWNRLSHKARLRPGDHVTIRLASNS
jgi:membrane-bound lytic murein transglycosylase D